MQNLLQNFACDIVLSDDGLQHYRLGRDIEIAMVDGMRRFGNQYLLQRKWTIARIHFSA